MMVEVWIRTYRKGFYNELCKFGDEQNDWIDKVYSNPLHAHKSFEIIQEIL